jgi:hypothetical protein
MNDAGSQDAIVLTTGATHNHVVHWADGGRSALDNLVLLCRRHHRLIHTGLRLEILDGEPAFRRDDGSILEGRAPP